MNRLPLFYDLSYPELAAALEARGEDAYRTHQIWQGIYRLWLSSPLQLTTLPKTLRAYLDSSYSFQPLTAIQSKRSKDSNTKKDLLQLRDGLQIEAVLMRYRNRHTACISTQVGCAIGCVFCATGQMGFLRNLSAGEIVCQVLHFSRQLALEGQSLTNIVLMGMGEPFHNYQATMKAIRILNDPLGLRFGARRISISTVGIPPMIDRFAQEDLEVNLAVSLHAATDDLRDKLIPINRRYPLDVLLKACRAYIELTSRRVTFEWALLQGVNDGLDQARQLAHRLRGMICHVNLIPLNPTHHYDALPSPQETARAFRDVLVSQNIATTLRLRRGIDINAGCGQLAIHNQSVERDQA